MARGATDSTATPSTAGNRRGEWDFIGKGQADQVGGQTRRGLPQKQSSWGGLFFDPDAYPDSGPAGRNRIATPPAGMNSISIGASSDDQRGGKSDPPSIIARLNSDGAMAEIDRSGRTAMAATTPAASPV